MTAPRQAAERVVPVNLPDARAAPANPPDDRAPAGHEPRVVQKALALLEAVARIGPGATAQALAAHAGLPPATAYRLLTLLVGDGFLVRVDDLAGFALGRRARGLATHVGAGQPLDVRAVADALRSDIRHGVHVVDLTGPTPAWVDRDPDHQVESDELMVRAGHASAPGKILLAARPELLTGSDLTRHTPYTITYWPLLLKSLTVIRATGVAVDHEESVLGRVGLAAVIHDGADHITGCILVAGRAGRLDPNAPDLVHKVRTASHRLTGWSGARGTVTAGNEETPPAGACG